MKFAKACALSAVAALALPAVNAEIGEAIVGGSVTAASDYPFMVSLQRSGRHFCGGSLIAPSVVLTAAHCTVYSASQMSIKVKGSNTNLNTNAAETFSIKSITDHPSYSSSTNGFDIAIIELNGRSSVDPVRFDVSNNQYDTSPRTISTVIGWGTTSSGGSASSRLLEVDVPLYSNADCRRTRYGNRISSSMICAGYDEGGRDSCQGDSGGPLFVGPKSDPLQVGVVSWGFGCAAANAPGVYARVTAARPFITQFTDSATSPPDTDAPTDGTVAPTDGGEEICNCDGGNGRFERCDLWYQTYKPQSDPLYNTYVCLLDYRGGQSNPPSCVAPEGGELIFSTNLSRWYMNGCSGTKKVTVEATPANDATLDGGSDSAVGMGTLVAAVSGSAAVAGLVTSLVAYNAGKKSAPAAAASAGGAVDNFSSFRVSGEGPFENAAGKA